MKFQKYLTETYTNLTIEVLLENCRPICETYVKTKGVLYRGIKKIHNEEIGDFRFLQGGQQQHKFIRVC